MKDGVIDSAMFATDSEVAAPAAPLVFPIWQLVLGNVVVAALVIGLIILMLGRDYREQQERVNTATQSVARMLAQNTLATIEVIDVSLRTVALEVDRQGAQGSIDAATMDRFLARQQALLPDLTSLRIADATGVLQYGVENTSASRVSVADREYFLRARDNPGSALVISDPVLSRITQQRTIVFARRLDHPDGSFAGVVYAGVTQEHFRSRLEEMSRGGRWVLGLRNSDLRLLAGYPSSDGVAASDEDAVPPPFHDAVLANGESGMYAAMTDPGRAERTFAYVRLNQLPLYAVAGLATADSLTNWRRHALGVSALGILALVAMLVSSAAVYLGWQRQAVADRERAGAARRVQLILQTASDGIHLLDDGGKLVEVNDAFCDLLGYRREELLGMGIDQIDVGLSPAVAVQAIRNSYTGRHIFEARHRRKDGRIIDVEVSATVVDLPGRRLSIASARDITERRHAEAEQQRLNRVLRLLSVCNMALVGARDEQQLLDDLCRLVVDSGGYLMSWVGVAEQDAAKSVRPVAHYGFEAGYLESVRISWDGEQEIGRGPTGTAIRTAMPQINRDYLNDPRMAPWREAALKRHYQASAAFPLIRDGQVLGALTLYAAVPDAFGADEVVLLEELSSNVSYGLQSLRARGELERYRLELEERVAERTLQIAALNDELEARARSAEAANRAKSDFLATMSHEIRTPLNAVIGLTGLLAATALDGHQRDYAEKIQVSTQALRLLIDDILDLSKIEAGVLTLERAPFSLDAILRTVAVIVSTASRGKAIETLIDVAPDTPDTLVGDALRLQQILLNLTSNAVKFTQSGEIVLSVRCGARQPGVVTLHFTVRDTGIGIPPERLGHIFEAFAQADVSTCREYGGTGLGLAICVRLAELMGGRIEVDSEVGRGSEFRFAATLAVADSQSATPSEERLSALRVLVIDDHPLARDVMQRTCAAFGWQTTARDRGETGLDELRRATADGDNYDLLLLDWHMPGMDGLELLRRAQAVSDIGLPLVILMASTVELEQAAAAAGDIHLDGMLAKPMTPASLLGAVTQAYFGEEPEDSEFKAGNTDGRLAGLRLLVAENNELNQLVAERILGGAGAEVVIVADGLEAVDVLRRAEMNFDAVLMDIQMPVMDGYAATRILREELGLTDLPIIAVTADALPEDRERSRRAGMAGHIVKPINVEALADIICCNGSKDVRGQLAGKPAHILDAGASDIVLPGLDVAAGVRSYGGDVKKYGELLRQFVVRHGRDVEEARRLFSIGETQGAIKMLHELRGVASFLRMTDLARLVTSTEVDLRVGTTEEVSFDEIQVAMHTLTDSITRLEAFAGDHAVFSGPGHPGR